MTDRPRGICRNYGNAIRHLDKEMWLHIESRKVSCELYASPLSSAERSAPGWMYVPCLRAPEPREGERAE